MTEAEFQTQVITLAKMGGWLVHAERPAQYQSGRWATHIQGHAGFPDLILLKPSRLIVAELKVGRNKPTEEQLKWLDYFHAVGLTTVDLARIESYVWRPEDMPAIIRTLTPAAMHSMVRT